MFQIKNMISQEEIEPLKDKGGEIKVLISPKTVGSKHMILGTSRIKRGEKIAAHLHTYSEEGFFVVEGMGKLIIENVDEVSLLPGRAYYIPKGVAHSIENTGEIDMFVIFASSPLAPKPEIGHKNLT